MPSIHSFMVNLGVYRFAAVVLGCGWSRVDGQMGQPWHQRRRHRKFAMPHWKLMNARTFHFFLTI